MTQNVSFLTAKVLDLFVDKNGDFEILGTHTVMNQDGLGLRSVMVEIRFEAKDIVGQVPAEGDFIQVLGWYREDGHLRARRVQRYRVAMFRGV